MRNRITIVAALILLFGNFANSAMAQIKSDNRSRATIPKEINASAKCQQYYIIGKKEKDAGHFANGERYLLAAMKEADASRNEQAVDWIAVGITELQTRYANMKRYDRCESLMKYVIQVEEHYKGKTSPHLASYLFMLSKALAGQGKTKEATEATARISTLK